MRKLFVILLFSLLSIGVWANGVVYNKGIITELYFEGPGQWTLEFRIEYLHHMEDTAFYLFSLSDSARFIVTPDSLGLYVCHPEDLSKTIYINPWGDNIHIRSYGESYGYVHLTDYFDYGNLPNVGVKAPFYGQSLVGLGWDGQYDNYIVKDNVHSPGYTKDPERGTIRGYTYDSLLNILPYQKIQLYGVESRTIWSDINGYFEDTTLYGRKYDLWIESSPYVHILDESFFIEPGQINNLNLTLPIGSEVTIEGNCYLSNANNHEGIFFIVTPECTGSIPDTAITDSSGFFSIIVPPGKYNYRFSKNGYLPHSNFYPGHYFNDSILESQTLNNGIVHEIPAGNISGNWIPDAEYWIMGNVYVEPGDSLILQPGVIMKFKGTWRFDIHGTIIAEGAVNDSIYFLTDMSGWMKWNSLNFYDDDNTTSKLSFTRIEKIFDGINFYNSSPEIKNSTLLNTSIITSYKNSAPSLLNNYINTFSGPSIVCRDSSAMYMSKNHIFDGGIRAFEDAHPDILYNTFEDQFVSISSYDQSHVNISGNVFYKCIVIWPGTNSGTYSITYNSLWESEPYWGTPNIPGYGVDSITNNNGDSCDIYFNLINKGPLMVDPENGDFHLLAGSPAIDAGDPDSPYDPDNTIADMGAYYFDQLGIYVKDPSPMESKYELMVIPNPNDGNFSISIKSPEVHQYEASLSIHSISGNLVETRNIAFLERGNNTISFSGASRNQNFIDGIYICAFSINGRVLTSTKLIINE